MTILLALFWVSVALVLYTYIGFPILLALRGWLWPKPHIEEDIAPTVSLIIAAYNEADVIEAKIENTLELDYPPEKLEVIIASDGSSDGTNEIVRGYEGHRVRLLDLQRGGKNATLNAAVEKATGEIIVFSDAPSMYATDALRMLVRHFADSTVGGVAGSQVYQSGDDSESLSGRAESLYWRMDEKLKLLQSRGGSVTSATGAIYAIRRKLYRRILPHVVDDSFISIGIVAQGKRLVFAPDACAFEPVAESGDKEFGRKLRVSLMGLYSVLETPELFNPRRYGFYSLQIFTHKILRRFLFLPLFLILTSSLALWPVSVVYQITAILQVAFYASAGVGMFVERHRLAERRGLRLLAKALAPPYYFCMVYLATMIAVVRVIRGKKIDRWETTGRTDLGVS